MESVFINISNHPSSGWQPEQLEAAKKIGVVYDLSFPEISPEWDTSEVKILVEEYFKKVRGIIPLPDEKSAIHIMGESVFTFLLVSKLIEYGYNVVASTTERLTSYRGNTKVSVFKFVRFRSYN